MGVFVDRDILVRNGFIDVPESSRSPQTPIRAVKAALAANDARVGTILSNIARYGYTLDQKTFAALMAADDLDAWYAQTEKTLRAITGANRKMDKHVVFKNFPREVLEMSRVESIFKQLLIYWGMPYDMLRETPETRPPLGDLTKLKALTLADDETEAKIYADLVAMKNRWNDDQRGWASKLIGARNAIVAADFGFKENAITLAAENFANKEFEPSSGTDMIRLCAGLSGADISLREKVKFRRFSRPERRRILAAMNTQVSLADDMALRPEPWKRLMERLRPGDYKKDFRLVVNARDNLYHGTTKPITALLDPQMPADRTLIVAAQRPGEFMRRFHHYYGVFGPSAAHAFKTVMEKLSTRQLAFFLKYLRTINGRKTLIYAPKSNWSRAQIKPNEKTKIAHGDIVLLTNHIEDILQRRIDVAFPEGIELDPRVDAVRLQTNDQKLAAYGRGTEFDIPPNMTFLRSASYWQKGGIGTTWYDNGWNFFDAEWKSVGQCSWDDQQFGSKRAGYAAVFSGDPVNTGDLKGRACQMIDLYPERLLKEGVRYAVWNVLCFSKKKFSEAEEVLATLQMGEDAESGKLYEPSRAQMVFPLKSAQYTSYVAYVDLHRNKLVYMDAPLKANVQSAGRNGKKLSEVMPAYVEYLGSIPTLYDVFAGAPKGSLPVMYDDSAEPVVAERGFVFRPERTESKYERLSLTDLVNV